MDTFTFNLLLLSFVYGWHAFSPNYHQQSRINFDVSLSLEVSIFQGENIESSRGNPAIVLLGACHVIV